MSPARTLFKTISNVIGYVLLILVLTGALLMARNAGKQEAADAMCRQMGHAFAGWNPDDRQWACYDLTRHET